MMLNSGRDKDGNRVMWVVPITHTPPKNPEDAVEVPAVTKRRLGLDDQRSWIVTREVNRFGTRFFFHADGTPDWSYM